MDGSRQARSALADLARDWAAATGADPATVLPRAVAALLAVAFHDLAVRRGTVPTLYAGRGLLDVAVPDGVEVPTLVCAEPDDLGRLHESLLDATARRHAGAHYTPIALADEVVRHALEPLVRDADVATVLDLRVADIAAGSGVFLVAAAEYLTARLVELGMPREQALRAVVVRCLHGADIDELAVEVCRLSLWLLVGDPDLPLGFLDEHVLVGNSLLGPEVSRDGELDPRWLPVPWERQFDAVVGNPPFLGVKGIRDALGGELRDHLADSVLDGESGRSDLAVFFLARACQLSRAGVGLVLPAAIWEGDNFRFGLTRAFADGFSCHRAETSRPWPSRAAVRVALVWLQRGASTAAVLDGLPVDSIPVAPISTTRRRDRPSWMPHGYQASIVLGKSLLLTRAEADAMLAEDPRAATWIREYLSGDDLVSTVGPSGTRCVLDLADADLDTLRAIAPIARRLLAVRAERDEQLARYPQLVRRWWGFLNRVDRLYDELAGTEEAMAFAKHAKFLWPVLVRTGPVFSNGAIVYPSADRAVYGFLASTPHRVWATEEGGSRLNQSHRYNPSRLLTTYPFPETLEPVRPAGEALAVAVAAAQAELGLGITEVLNLVSSADDQPAVVGLRSAIVEVDRAVLAAHRITDVVLDHGVQTGVGTTWFGPGAATTARLRSRLVALAGPDSRSGQPGRPSAHG